MTQQTTARKATGAAAAPLTHWLILVLGLAVLTLLRMDEPERVVPIWVGSVLGTALGQLFARLRLRLWLSVFFTLNLMWFGPLMMLPVLGHPWGNVESSVLAFAPAAVCGWFSMSERGGLIAFWYPATLWTLSIVDSSSGAAFSGTESWLLLSGLAALFLGFMRARESRRVALWRSHALDRLAEPRGQTSLRESPLRFVGQIGWTAAVGAATLLLTAWIAPHLWQKDKLENRIAKTPNAESQPALAHRAGGDDPLVCCPEEGAAEVQRERVREYFPLLHPRDEETTKSFPARCAMCRDGVAMGVPGAPTQLVADPDGPLRYEDPRAPVAVAPFPTAIPQVDPATVVPGPIATVAPSAAPTTTLRPPPTAVAAAPTAPPAPPPSHAAAPPPPLPRALPPTPAPAALARPHKRPVVITLSPAATATREEPGHVFQWLLLFSILWLTVHTVARPLRRLLTVRHLARPLWKETVDQRVSNLWQLVLIGLRDAGFCVIPGEQPQDLARRVGVDGIAACAAVLERARHGVRVDAADLEIMQRAARSAYAAARGRASWAARAVACLRWPLV